MQLIVYTLCAFTSLAVAVLLLRGWARSRSPLLLWSGLCFSGFFLNNVLVLVDHFAKLDLFEWRTVPALAGIALLVYGLVWRSEARG
jgi:hypothetical protein